MSRPCAGCHGFLIGMLEGTGLCKSCADEGVPMPAYIPVNREHCFCRWCGNWLMANDPAPYCKTCDGLHALGGVSPLQRKRAPLPPVPALAPGG